MLMNIDALPQLGHACGHNLIASSSVAAALATAKIMEDAKIQGKVILFGTPAEESMLRFRATTFHY
jgi:metal-dependent amidase/aminoacylase/carboxypeptidase family protein